MLLLITWTLVFLLALLPIAAARTWLLGRGETDERIVFAGPLVFTAALGYAAFWAFFLHHVLGQIFSFAALIASGSYVVWQNRKVFRATLGLLRSQPVLLTFGIGLFYLALLYLPQLGREPEWQSQVRFLYEFPMDANLPKLLGDRLYDGVSPKPFLPEAEWLSSDRPPLQSGLYLLFRPCLDLVHLPVGLGYQCIGTLAQLCWVPAVWLVGRRLKVFGLVTPLVVLFCATSGFLLFNSTYVWPKLLAGGLTLLAGTLFLDRSEPRTLETSAIAGSAAALGWLAHGGAAFSLATLALLLVLPRWHPGFKKAGVAVLMFAVFAAPWLAYQHLYDPPGNRLIKWHLAGVIPVDTRGTLETMRDSYSALPAATLIANKRANFTTLFHGTFRSAFDVFTTSLRERRVDEFFYVFRSLGVLNVAWFILPILWFWRRRYPERLDFQGALLAWALATLIVWPLLMFIPSTTILHQGPYALMLTLFLLAVIFIAEAPWWIGLPVLAWHALAFGVTWLPYYKSAPLQPIMFGLIALASALIAVAIRDAARVSKLA